MSSKAPRRLAAQLDVIPFAFEKPPGDLDWVHCVHCQQRLDLHQPDLQSPARLVGICEGCRRWFLVLMEPDTASAMMVALPENEWFQSEWDSHEGSA